MNKNKANSEGQTSATFVNGKPVKPVAAKTNQPAQASVAMAKPVLLKTQLNLMKQANLATKPEIKQRIVRTNARSPEKDQSTPQQRQQNY